MDSTIVLFGETERGEYHAAYFCTHLQQLVDHFGNAPSQSQGLYYAVRALLYHHQLIFFRVREEGFSTQDYAFGANFLHHQEAIPRISAICLPGVGSHEIFQTVTPLCTTHRSILIITEADLYDYLMQAA